MGCSCFLSSFAGKKGRMRNEESEVRVEVRGVRKRKKS